MCELWTAHSYSLPQMKEYTFPFLLLFWFCHPPLIYRWLLFFLCLFDRMCAECRSRSLMYAWRRWDIKNIMYMSLWNGCFHSISFYVLSRYLCVPFIFICQTLPNNKKKWKEAKLYEIFSIYLHKKWTWETVENWIWHFFFTKFSSCNLSSLSWLQYLVTAATIRNAHGNWAHVNVTSDEKHTIDLMLKQGAFWALIELIKWRCYSFNMFDMLMLFASFFHIFLRSISIPMRWQFDQNRCAWLNRSIFYLFFYYYLCSIVQYCACYFYTSIRDDRRKRALNNNCTWNWRPSINQNIRRIANWIVWQMGKKITFMSISLKLQIAWHVLDKIFFSRIHTINEIFL